MRTPYLIQRCMMMDIERDNERTPSMQKKGIDKILSFDYMGSAEFEFGALGKSLKEIRKHIDDYEFFDVTFGDKRVDVFAPKANKEVVIEYLKGLVSDKYHLKEFIGFRDWIQNMGRVDKFFNENCWWDIENHYFFWKMDSHFLSQFRKLIKGESHAN